MGTFFEIFCFEPRFIAGRKTHSLLKHKSAFHFQRGIVTCGAATVLEC